MMKTVQYRTALRIRNVLLRGMICCVITAGLPDVAADKARPPATGHFYEDDRIRVLIPTGWVAKPLPETTEITTGTQTYQVPIGGVLSEAGYRIYLLTHYGQASGIQGGRFGEISKYVSPWMKVEDPWGCIDALSEAVTPVTEVLSRVDLFFDSSPLGPSAFSDCRHLHSPVKAPVWFGSFFSQASSQVRSGFFLTFPLGKKEIEDPEEEMVFALTIDTKNPEALPAKTDRELGEFLHEASEIVRSIRYK